MAWQQGRADQHNSYMIDPIQCGHTSSLSRHRQHERKTYWKRYRLSRTWYGNRPTVESGKNLDKTCRDRGSLFISGRASNSTRERSCNLFGFRLRWALTRRIVWDTRNNLNTFGGDWLRRTTIRITRRNNLWWRLAIYKNRQVRNWFQDTTVTSTEHIIGGFRHTEAQYGRACKNCTPDNKLWDTSTSLPSQATQATLSEVKTDTFSVTMANGKSWEEGRAKTTRHWTHFMTTQAIT